MRRKAVANGIAYDAAEDRLFVTGKNWPRLFEIRLARIHRAKKVRSQDSLSITISYDDD